MSDARSSFRPWAVGDTADPSVPAPVRIRVVDARQAPGRSWVPPYGLSGLVRGDGPVPAASRPWVGGRTDAGSRPAGRHSAPSGVVFGEPRRRSHHVPIRKPGTSLSCCGFDIWCRSYKGGGNYGRRLGLVNPTFTGEKHVNILFTGWGMTFLGMIQPAPRYLAVAGGGGLFVGVLAEAHRQRRDLLRLADKKEAAPRKTGR